MTAGHPAAAPSIRHVIAVPDLDQHGSDSAARAPGSTVPGPAVFGDEAASACAEGKIFPVTERNGGRIVDVGFTVERRRLRKQSGNRRGQDNRCCWNEGLHKRSKN